MPTSVTINGKAHSVDLPGDVPLLWVLREALLHKPVDGIHYVNPA